MTSRDIIIIGAGHNGLVAAYYLAKAGFKPLVLERRDIIGRALRSLLTMTPPNLDAPSKSELWGLGKLGWKIRGLGKKDEYRLLRYGPMAVADLAAEWFDNELLRALVAARGIFGAFAGP